MSESKENRALDTLLNEGVKFKVRIRVFGFAFKVPFKIKPLRLGTIFYLSKQRVKLSEVSEDEPVHEMFDKADNLKPFARCIALSVLNSRLPIKLFTCPLAKIFYWNLSVSEMHELMTVVVSQMNVRDFFLTTGLVRGFQVVDRTQKADTSRKKQSGAQSGKFQKS